MKRKIYSIIIFLILICVTFLTFSSTSNSVESPNENDWYYLPGYPNYAPNGLPDFSQRQQEDWSTGNYPGFCGAVALADILWWFDSKHEDPNGYPGDGNDIYPLVQDYNPPGSTIPGPYSDDHSYNNVNDNQTIFYRFRRNGELIERIAWYIYRFKDAFWPKLFSPLITPYIGLKIYTGAKKCFREAGLQNHYSVKLILKPNFSTIDQCVRNNNGVILGLLGYNPDVKPFSITGGHFVAVAGVNSKGAIAFSDPFSDRINPCSDFEEHNDAGIVSHDVYNVSLNSPWPRLCSWYLPKPDYYKDDVIVVYALIISETN